MWSGVQQLKTRRIEEQVRAARDRVLRRHMYPYYLRQL
jgi:hypothetical protein